ncbi:S8 family serine peptidase [Anaerovorax odorimutans]|uniref:S8 family serine peptidase n=1 Tax=Anaerovorax odorimutans TaxID=109327 RepID=A0ABT1RJ97_9FIRM|nr:S8 family serine peptidase [Anaerovorax odorimutans]MCQ4635253.1 S8 family serine peptidase [Anaerovorax odorimutans]
MKKRKFTTRGAICLVTVFIMTFVLGWPGIEVSSAETSSDLQRLSRNNELKGTLWNLDYMDVPEAWDLIDELKPKQQRQESDKISVATLDTGIDYNHPDLQGNVDVENCVAVAGVSAPYAVYDKPSFSHGTKTAGVIAATSRNHKGIDGVAAGNDNDLISLMGINVFRDNSYTAQSNATTEDIIKGLNYACEHGARVINMCLGHAPGSTDILGNPHNDKALEKAINDAVYKKNVVVVCSAGNHNNEKTWYPSDFDATISVINTQRYTNAWSRNCKAPRSNYGRKKDLSAPGTGVYTTTLGGSYVLGSGTSYAAPSVAGVAALMLYVNPGLKAWEVKDILCSTATDLHTKGYDIYTGHGNVNAYRAVAAAAGRADGRLVQTLPQPAAKAQSAGRHSIEISWDPVPRANGYWIYRATKENGTYKKIKRVDKGNQRSYRDGDCSFNKGYFYKVKAYGTTEDGKKIVSDFSPLATAKARGSGRVSAFNCKTINYKTIKLSWKKVKSADGYVVYRKAGKNDTYRQVKSVSRKSVSWKNTGLKPGQKYYYKICSYRKVGGKRYYGEPSKVKTAAARPARPVLTLKKNASSITLKWTKISGISGYKIYRSRNSSGRWRMIKKRNAGSRKFVNKDLREGVKYRYKIRAYKRIHGKYIYSAYSAVKAKRM